MDINETFETEDLTEPNFGVELGKSFAISAASVAGSFAALFLLGLVLDGAQKAKKRRAAKKHPDTPTEK
jgi:hypothetical protein